MTQITEEIAKEVRDIVCDFFSEECEKEVSELSDETNIIEDLEGDSLMFLELLEMIKSKYKLKVELQEIGKYILKNQADTIGMVINLTLKLIEHNGKIAEIETN
jgi:acyl carrier protein